MKPLKRRTTLELLEQHKQPKKRGLPSSRRRREKSSKPTWTLSTLSTYNGIFHFPPSQRRSPRRAKCSL
jgi:hypothetical protein